MKNILFFCALFVTCISFSQELMSEFEFTQYLQEEVSKSNKKLRVLIFDELILGSKYNNASFLHNLKDDYPNYTSNPESLEQIVEELTFRVDSIYAPNLEYRIDSTKIAPLLKPKKFLNTIMTSDEGELVYDTFNDELVIVYVEDQDSGYLGYRFFSTNELNRIGYEKRNLYDLSLRNLKAMLDDFSEYILDQEKYRFYRSVGHDGGGKYLSSLLLLPDFLEKEKKRLRQNLVVGLPKSNQLIIIAKKNRAGIGEIRRYAASSYFLKEDELLTKKLYLWDGTKLKRF